VFAISHPTRRAATGRAFRLCLACVALLVGGCAGLPEEVQRQHSKALNERMLNAEVDQHLGRESE
jgi:hypothetical protein